MLVQGNELPVDEATKTLGLFEWAMVPELRIQELKMTISYKGAEDIDGLKNQVVEYGFPDGSKILNYFSNETGLKTKTVREQDSALGHIVMISKFSDYRAVRGIKFPYEVTKSMASMEMKYSVSKLEVNIDLDDGLFTLKF